MQSTSTAAIIIKVIKEDSVDELSTTSLSESNININSESQTTSLSDSSHVVADDAYKSQVTINELDSDEIEQKTIETTVHDIRIVNQQTQISDELITSTVKSLVSKLTITEFIKYSKNYAKVYDYNFPNYCDNEDSCSSDSLNKLIDPNDNYIQVGSSIIYVNHGKYYDKIFQFDEGFVALLGTSFRAIGLSESLFFNEETYILSGDIPFTEPKTITFIVNETYKYTLILKVDVHECFVE